MPACQRLCSAPQDLSFLRANCEDYDTVHSRLMATHDLRLFVKQRLLSAAVAALIILLRFSFKSEYSGIEHIRGIDFYVQYS